MKRIIIAVLAVAVLLTVCACSGGKGTVSEQERAESAADISAPEPRSAEESAEPHSESAEESSGSPAPQPVAGSEGIAVSESDTECTVTGIGTCTLTDIVIPSHVNGKPVVRIDESAFQENNAITSVVIPWTVRTIDEDAFAGCSALASVTFSEGLENIDESAFYGCASLKSLTLPASVTNISSYAFANCRGLEEVTLLGGTDIRKSAFDDCASLRSFAVRNPSGVAYSIQNNAFSGCQAIEKLDLAPGLTEIGSWNFADTANLKTVFLPKSLTALGACAFLRSGLTTVYYEGSEDEWKNVQIKEPTFAPEIIYGSAYNG